MPSSPCLAVDRSPYEKMLEAIEFSEVNRADADALIATHHSPQERALRQRAREAGAPMPNERQVWQAAEIRAGSDPQFTNAQANERWGWRLATMYGTQTLVQLTLVSHDLLSTLVAEVRELRREVAELRETRGDTTPSTHDAHDTPRPT